MDKIFNHEESLSLINEMISRARNNFQKEKMYSMIYWGYITAAIAILNYALLQFLNNPNQSFWIWLLMFPAGIVSHFIDRYVNRTVLVKHILIGWAMEYGKDLWLVLLYFSRYFYRGN